MLGDEGSVLHGARGALTAGLAAGFRPQLFLKFLDHLLQVLPGLPLVQEVGAELLAVGLGVLQLHLQVLDLRGQTDNRPVGHRARAEPVPPHRPCTESGQQENVYSRHGIIQIEATKEFPVPFFRTLLQYSACLAWKPKYSQ